MLDSWPPTAPRPPLTPRHADDDDVFRLLGSERCSGVSRWLPVRDHGVLQGARTRQRDRPELLLRANAVRAEVRNALRHGVRRQRSLPRRNLRMRRAALHAMRLTGADPERAQEPSKRTQATRAGVRAPRRVRNRSEEGRARK